MSKDRKIQLLSATLDSGPGPRGRVGFIALANGHTSELEMREILPYPDVALYVNRVNSKDEITIEILREMEADLSRAASLILPSGRLDVMVYGCTSGTVAMGEEAVERRIHSVRPGIPVSTPVTAAFAALAALNCHRIVLLTPYVEAVARETRTYLEKESLNVVHAATCGIERDSDMNRVSPSSLRSLARDLDRPEADAVFICCTALRANSIIELLEQDLGKPVISSNQALAWHALRLLDVHDPVPGYGRLLRTPLAVASLPDGARVKGRAL